MLNYIYTYRHVTKDYLFRTPWETMNKSFSKLDTKHRTISCNWVLSMNMNQLKKLWKTVLLLDQFNELIAIYWIPHLCLAELWHKFCWFGIIYMSLNNIILHILFTILINVHRTSYLNGSARIGAFNIARQ